jgi:AcrR family transcriptional regulator
MKSKGKPPARQVAGDGDGESSRDGRARRGARSSRAIVDALFELVGEEVLDPTAQQVAERARVGLRSVFRHFSDMESLYAAMDERLLAEVAPMLMGGEPRGAIGRRARDLVARRVALFDRVAPYKRAANRKRAGSDYLAARHRALVRQLRSDVLRWLPELARGPDDLVDAIDFILSFESWDNLRNDRGLSRARAQAAVERAVLTLVEQAGR